MRKFTLILFLFMMISEVSALGIHYQVSIQNPHTHYADVVMAISGVKGRSLSVSMPVWTPGSYMIREFEKNVLQVQATGAQRSLKIRKSAKNTWTIDNAGAASDIEVRYRVYCFENTVRTSYIDADHAFLLMSSCLMFTENQGAGTLELQYPENWNSISTTLKEIRSGHYAYESYDELADSPIEIGKHRELRFEVQGVEHRVAMVGMNNCETVQFVADLKKICQSAYSVMKVQPCSSYLFIVHHVDEGGGGLEHANSSVVQMPRFHYSNKEKYLSFLSLCAHEYFHLWNVKRIRPAALGPFNYHSENYSNLLWVAEGITSYYDELIMYRAGFRTRAEYLKTLAGTLSATLNRKGAEIQSMHEASYDAWIKEYRPNENSINSGISYYMKGAALAALLDIELISATAGKKNLDDLMRLLYDEYYIRLKRGFSDDEFYASIDQLAGKPLHFRRWAEEPNHAETGNLMAGILKKVSCTIENKAPKHAFYTGINTETKGEKISIRSVDALSPAYGADLQAGDELIALNGVRLKGSPDDLIRQLGSDRITFLISRGGLIRSTEISLSQNPKLELQISEDNPEAELLNVWLKKD